MSAEPAQKAVARGRALLDLRRNDDAEKAFVEALSAEPDDAYILCNLSLARLRAGRYAEALEAAGQAAAVEPEYEWPHRLRSIALLDQGKTKAAVAAARESVRLAPDLSDAHLVLGRALNRRREWEAARDAALRARELAPEDPNPHCLLGEIALDMDHLPQAEAHYRRALALDPEDTEALNNLGLALLRRDRKDEATQLFEQTVRLDPSDDIARSNLATAARQGMHPTLLFIATAYFTVQGIARLLDPDKRGLGILFLLFAAGFGIAMNRASKQRVQQLDPAVRDLVERQSLPERLQVSRWRPLFWFIPSPVYFAFCASAAVYCATQALWGTAAFWAALAVVFGHYARRWLRRRGWISF